MAQSSNGSPSSKDSEVERPESIDEALRILDRALAGKAASLSEMVTAELSNLKISLSDFTSGSTASMSEAVSKTKTVYNDVYSNIDSQVRRNPWPVIGGVAAGTFVLGYFLSTSTGKEGMR